MIFPEAPGSFAETGYFSAIEKLSEISILVLNQNFQGPDSFISLGPARKIGAKSFYHPVLQLDYANPDFEDIAERIRRLNHEKPRKHFDIEDIEKFSDLSSYELFCLLHEIVNLMIIANFDDIKYILNGLFKSHISIPKIKKILSILVGSEYLSEIGEFGHFRKSNKKQNLLQIRGGNKNDLDDIRLEISDICYRYKPDFISIMEAAQDAD